MAVSKCKRLRINTQFLRTYTQAKKRNTFYIARINEYLMSNYEISLQQAIDMITRYKANRPVNFPLSEKFDVEAINKLISPEDCKYLRIYYGMKEDMEVHAILVAANATDEDLLPSNEAAENDNVIVEDSLRCPPVCPPPSPLNGE